VLRFISVRVGFVRSLLWHRYGFFWSQLLADGDADVAYAEPEEAAHFLDDDEVREIPGRGFRAAAAEALALASCDVIIAPSLNAGYMGSKGSAQDPFVNDLPSTLAAILPRLPRVLPVPTSLSGPGLDTLAVSLLSLVNPSPGMVRRIWQTHQANAHPPSLPLPPQPGPSESVIGVVGQPWNLGDSVMDSLREPNAQYLRADQFEPSSLREEGWRIDERLAPTDAEALGAVRRMTRRSDVASFLFVMDSDAGADAWLERRVMEEARKPVARIELPDVAFSFRTEGTSGTSGAT